MDGSGKPETNFPTNHTEASKARVYTMGVISGNDNISGRTQILFGCT